MKDKFFSDEELTTLKKIALEEMQELYENLQPALEALREDPGDEKARKNAELYFHTIGGSAALAGLGDISEVGLQMESALKKAPAGKPLDAAMTDSIAGALGRLGELIRGYTP
jgi:chemotaxis protein histidine kinase CheA